MPATNRTSACLTRVCIQTAQVPLIESQLVIHHFFQSANACMAGDRMFWNALFWPVLNPWWHPRFGNDPLLSPFLERLEVRVELPVQK